MSKKAPVSWSFLFIYVRGTIFYNDIVVMLCSDFTKEKKYLNNDYPITFFLWCLLNNIITNSNPNAVSDMVGSVIYPKSRK